MSPYKQNIINSVRSLIKNPNIKTRYTNNRNLVLADFIQLIESEKIDNRHDIINLLKKKRFSKDKNSIIIEVIDKTNNCLIISTSESEIESDIESQSDIESLSEIESQSEIESEIDSEPDIESPSNKSNNNYLLIDSSSDEEITKTNKMEYYTVNDINYIVKNLINKHINKNISLLGEIANMSKHNGNVYLCLKDNYSKIKGVIWKSIFSKISNNIKNGDLVKVTGNLELYIKGGEYQINIKTIQHQGIGNMSKSLEILKKQLQEKGYFNTKNKKNIKKWNTHIGIVSSQKAAGFGDLISRIKAKNPLTKLILANASVQGNLCVREIVSAIQKLNNYAISNKLDLILIIRGGGSKEDLEGFDHINIVNAIRNSKIPIVTGIGHEKDVSLADLTADYCAITPTAAGEKVTADYKKIKDLLTNNKHLISKLINDKIDKTYLILKDKFQSVQKNDKNLIKDLLLEKKDFLTRIINNKIVYESNKLNINQSKLINSRINYFNDFSMMLSNYRNTLNNEIENKIKKENENLVKLNHKILISKPNYILKQGFNYFIDIDNNQILGDKQSFLFAVKNNHQIQINFNNNESIIINKLNIIDN